MPTSPAKKAAILLFILGGLGAAMGLCVGSIMWLIPNEQLPIFVDQLKGAGEQAPQGMAPEQFVRTFYTTRGTVAVVIGGILILLAVFVRRASKAGVIVATTICGLMTVNSLFGLLFGGRLALNGNPMMMMTACFTLVPLSLFGLITIWLVQLLRALPGVQAAQRQQQSQYYQSQQQQAYYNANLNGGYPPPGYSGQAGSAPASGQGYAMPPAAPAPPAPEQPQPPTEPK